MSEKAIIPLKTKNVIRFLILVVIILAIAAGYYHSLYQNEAKKYKKLEDKYVRVRGELGREETQRIIDQSYEQ